MTPLFDHLFLTRENRRQQRHRVPVLRAPDPSYRSPVGRELGSAVLGRADAGDQVRHQVVHCKVTGVFFVFLEKAPNYY